MSNADDDYVSFKELNHEYQEKAHKAYAGMLFDMESREWWKTAGEDEMGFSPYQDTLLELHKLFSRFNRPLGGPPNVSFYGWLSNNITVKYKDISATGIGSNWNRPPILSQPRVCLNVTSDWRGSPLNIFAANSEGEPPYGLLNHPDLILYSGSKWSERWVKAWENLWNALIEERAKNPDAFNESNQGLELLSTLNEMWNEVGITQGVSTKDPPLNIDFETLDLMKFMIQTGLGEGWGLQFTIDQPICNTHSSGFSRTQFTSDKASFSLNAGWDAEEGGDLRLITLSQAVQEIDAVLAPDARGLLGTALYKMNQVAKDGVNHFIYTVSGILTKYAKALEEEVAKRTHTESFSKWADEKGLRFHRYSGVMMNDKIKNLDFDEVYAKYRKSKKG